MTQKRIVRRPKNPEDYLSGLESLSPLLKRLYFNRGINAPKELEHTFNHLLSFESLTDISKATQRLFQALKNQERIIIVGDYDVDGATSTALMIKVLRRFGFQQVDFLIPNRFEYGYGLSPEIVQLALSRKPQLIITVDNGIASIEGVLEAKKHGIDVIVTDHHLPGSDLPEAVAIVNPNQKNDVFPSKNLAGVGVAFYVLLALRALLREVNWFEKEQIPEPNLAEYLGLVSLGTVSDMVVLDHNNRILVEQGLHRMRAGLACPGIYALLEVVEKEAIDINTDMMGFVIAPRLNAAGRLDDMSLGVNCLLAETLEEARRFAKQLDRLNNERKDIGHSMQQEAFRILDRLTRAQSGDLPFGLCLMDENWHEGIIGILASRLKEAYYRPAIVFAPQENGNLKGSARSIAKCHIRDVLESIANENPTLIDHFGGHAMAAGLSLPAEKFHEFRDRFNEKLQHLLTKEDLEEILMSDGELSTSDYDLNFAKLLEKSGPWGSGFPEPLFDGIFDVIDQRIVGQRHLKMILKREHRILDAICFNVDLDEWPNHRCEQISILYQLAINKYKGRESLQLLIKHLSAI